MSQLAEGTVCHLAGPSITVAGRTVQRCCWCGAKLCDSQGTAAPINPDGSMPKFPVWPVGEFIRVSAGQPTSYVLVPVPNNGPVPLDFCWDFA